MRFGSQGVDGPILGAFAHNADLEAGLGDLEKGAGAVVGVAGAEVALLVDVLRVLRYVDGDRLAATTLGRAVVALDHHQHEAELGDLSSAPPSGLGRLALVAERGRP